MYGPRQGPRPLPWAKCQIFLEVFFICNNINTNLNKIFHTQFHTYSFKPLFLFFQISARSSLKKCQNEKFPKAGYLPLCLYLFKVQWRLIKRPVLTSSYEKKN